MTATVAASRQTCRRCRAGGCPVTAPHVHPQPAAAPPRRRPLRAAPARTLRATAPAGSGRTWRVWTSAARVAVAAASTACPCRIASCALSHARPPEARQSGTGNAQPRAGHPRRGKGSLPRREAGGRGQGRGGIHRRRHGSISRFDSSVSRGSRPPHQLYVSAPPRSPPLPPAPSSTLNIPNRLHSSCTPFKPPFTSTLGPARFLAPQFHTPPHPFNAHTTPHPATQVLRNPVIAADGVTYEEAAIRRHMATGSKVSPSTGRKLPGGCTELFPNRALRQAVQFWAATNQVEALLLDGE
eukprot:360946-Chlamydomonas_euryale.AAC.19